MKDLKTSVCITVYDEEESIAKLLGSLLKQTLKPDEIVIVDGGSTDDTVKIIKEHISKKGSPSWIKMGLGGVSINLIVKKCTRAEGRNLSVKKAKNEIIAMTDADCIADNNWLKRITQPFENKYVDISAGFYTMDAEDAFQKAEAVFLGVVPAKFSTNFLPSTRSIAFRKKIWKKIGGFPEGENNSAEDTDFNFKAVKIGANYSRVKNAVVEWSIPDSIGEFVKKIYSYAKWDAEYGIWWHPVKKLASHNIKVLFVFFRYLLGIVLLIFSFSYNVLLYPVLILIFLYSFWAFYKVFTRSKSIEAGVWGILLQYIADVSVMFGFTKGVINKLR